MNLDIKDFYLAAPMERPEYIRVKASIVLPEILDAYDLHHYVEDGYILFQVDRCMYGFAQAGYISQKRLFAHLESKGFHQSKHVPCLFRHDTYDVTFVVVVDDFAVKYSDKSHVQYLIDSLQELYELTIDWDGKKYLGFTIEFDDTMKTVSLSMMPDYIPKQLQRFFPGQVVPGSPVLAVYIPPKYGKTGQQPVVEDETDPLSADELTYSKR
jgi:hypothetical protein